MSSIEIENVQSELTSKLTIESEETDQTKIEPTQINETGETNSNKQKKKLTKLADSILKKANGTFKLNTIEDKYYAMIQCCLDLQEQNKKLQLSGKEAEKTVANMSKLRELALNDYNKALFAKEKLESLCRELQKHNKLIKEENLQRIKEEEEKRKEMSVKFQSAIDEINQQVGSNSEKNGALIEENNQLSAKLKGFIEQYEAREQHIEKILKHKELETELANAKLQQSELKLTEATERNKAEKAIYENHITELNKKIEFNKETERQLKSQLSMYTEKYEEFQNTLKKSNQVFEQFKTEMDKMSKKIKKLEQETTTWKSKWENSEKTLQNVVKQKEEMDEKTKKAQARADIMENLSRTLQTERNELKEKLKKYEQPIEVSKEEPEKKEDETDAVVVVEAQNVEEKSESSNQSESVEQQS